MNSQIVFIRDFSGNNSDLFRIDLNNTSSHIRLTSVLDDFFTRYVNSGTCSIDGSTIIFSIGSGVYSVDSTGTNLTTINYGNTFGSVHWSNTTERLVFNAILDGDNNQEIYSTDLQGSDLTALTDNSYNDVYPVWSPDGVTIASVYRENDTSGMTIINTNSMTSTRITQSTSRETTPAWSPDGQRIAFASNRDGMLNIYTIRPDGSDVQQITSNSGNNLYPVWSQDGQWLAFSSDRDGVGYQIYIMNVNSGDIQRITGSEYENSDNFPQCWIGSYTPSTPTPIPTNTPTSTPT